MHATLSLPKHFLQNPHIRLFGDIDDPMVTHFLDQLDRACNHDVCEDSKRQVVVEVSSSGGTADNASRICEEIRLAREYHNIDFLFLGKTFVYSAGVTIMGAFPRNKRLLTRNTTLLLHERRLTKTINLAGPMRANIQIIKEVLADLENGLRVETENFAQFVQGSDVSMDEVVQRSRNGWYLTAEEALARKLVEGLI
jgi:ATP-dependent protease ClpP protease subunit